MSSPAYTPPPRQAGFVSRSWTPEPTRHPAPCTPVGCAHQTFGGTVCALCGAQGVSPTVTLTQDDLTDAVEPAVQAATSLSFLEGERAAYRRVLAHLETLPEALADRTRDKGRGAAHGAAEVRQYVLALLADTEDHLEAERAD